MPFIGKNKTTGERINILGFESPRDSFAPGSIVCPACSAEFFIKQGLLIANHFCHKGKKCEFKSHPESHEHLKAKQVILKRAGEYYKDIFGIDGVLEFPVKEVKRIIDVAFVFPNGWIVAHEAQFSGITTGELQERTSDYERAGIQTIWWLGGRAARSKENQEWCYRNNGGRLLLFES